MQPQFFAGAEANAAASDTYRELNLFGDVFERVRADYVEVPDDTKLIENAINGMLAGLDPHSSYMNPKDFQDMQVQTSGKFGGLGIEVTMEDGIIKVISPIDDTPASKAGILANDQIIAIDGNNVQGLTLNDAVDKMRGPVDTPITLTIQRPDVRSPLTSSWSAPRSPSRRCVRAPKVTSATSASPRSANRPSTASRQPSDKLKTDIGSRQDQGLHHRPAQQPGRPARPVGRGLRRIPQPAARSFRPAAGGPTRRSASTPIPATSPTASR